MKSKGAITPDSDSLCSNSVSIGDLMAHSRLSNEDSLIFHPLELEEGEALGGDSATVSPLIRLKQKMVADSIAAVMQSGRYLTSEQIAELSGLEPQQSATQLKKWINAGKIFEIHFRGSDYYPDFGLVPADHYHPFLGLKPVLDVFSGHKCPWKIAFWFCSVNGFLQRRCPQDLLQQEPALVLAAAKDEVRGIQHG